MADQDKLRARYGASEHGNFAVFDTISVPHPYCIGPKHVAYASDYRCGMLDESAIEAAERGGAHCMTPGCELKWKEHETALLVECKAAIKEADGTATPELHAYLLKVKPLCEADKYAGFAFMASKENAVVEP